MSALSWPDWRKIGWHVGKKLRDILDPSPDGGPSKEERAARRAQDAWKGFTYMDTFEELEEWNPNLIDPIQQANTTLLQRPPKASPAKPESKSKILLCHDYSGGYQGYESVRPSAQGFESYSCEHLQLVDTFIYFSHKLASAPPPSWINSLHRNGTRVLGTFILEPQTSDVERTICRRNGRFVVADQLVSLADTIGFDGWLLNIECTFPNNSTDELVQFIRYLRIALGEDRQVIWYDALTVHNQVKYQNGLTEKNLIFAREADAIFTNYKWTLMKLQETEFSAQRNGINLSDIFFGVDVWAQNTNMPGPPRATFPASGGGGTNTGFAVKELARRGFSTAIFGPAWTHEHFSPKRLGGTECSMSSLVAKSQWDGTVLPNDLGCDCREEASHHTDLYIQHPIGKYAEEYPRGSSTFFETSFTGAFSLSVDGDGQDQYISTLSCQEIRPCLANRTEVDATPATNALRVAYAAQDILIPLCGQALGIYLQAQDSPYTTSFDSSVQRFHLFNVAIPDEPRLITKLKYSMNPYTHGQGKPARFGLYYQFRVYSALEYEYLDLQAMADESGIAIHPLNSRGGRVLEGIGAFYKGPPQSQEIQLFCCHSIAVVSASVYDSERHFDFTISNIRILERRDGADTHRRLAWDWGGDRSHWPSNMPWSKTTGPFSHFAIFVDGKEMGVAHCSEFPLADSELDMNADSIDSMVFIRGSYFGGLRFDKQPSARWTLHPPLDNTVSQQII